MLLFYAESGPPENLTIISVTSSSVSLSWTEPSEPNGLILYYEVEVRNSLAEDEYYNETCSESPCTINELDECTNYSFSVTAVNKAGKGQYSDVQTDSTLSGGEKLCTSKINVTSKGV